MVAKAVGAIDGSGKASDGDCGKKTKMLCIRCELGTSNTKAYIIVERAVYLYVRCSTV